MATKREQILSATAAAASTTAQTISSDLRYITSVSAQCNITSSASLSAATVQLQGSNDNSNWVDIGSSQNVTADGALLLEDTDVSYRWCRVKYVNGAGPSAYDIEVIIAGKERK